MLKKKQKLVEKLFSRSQADQLVHDPLAASSLPNSLVATQKEEASPVVLENTPDRVESTSHAGETEADAGGDVVEEKLFTVHNAHPQQAADSSHMSHSHKKRRKFKFKKGAVAPEEQT